MFLLLKLPWYFFHNSWAMWYIKTVYFSHEIKLDNAGLIFKHFISFWFVNYFCVFLNIFRTPVLAGRSHEFMFVSPSVSLPICPSVSRHKSHLSDFFDFLHSDRCPWRLEKSGAGFIFKKIFCMCFKLCNYIRVFS